MRRRRRLHDLADATPADLPARARPRRGAAAVAVDRRRRRRARPAHDRRAAAVRPLHRRRRAPRASPRRCTARRRGSRPWSSNARRPGGQAGQSAAIENYLGFPRGLSGADLTHRAVTQARRFGAEMVLARDVVGFEARGPVRAVRFADGSEIEARTVLVATGVSYRLLEAPGLGEPHRTRRVLRRRRQRQPAPCEGEDVYIVGAANSAGQAVAEPRPVRPAGRAARARPTRSRRRCRSTSSSGSHAGNIEVRLQTEVVGGHGDEHLEAITLADRRDRHRERSRRTGCSSSSAPRRAPTGSAPDVARDDTGLRRSPVTTCDATTDRAGR